MEKKTFTTFTPTIISQEELLAKIAEQKAADVIQKNYSIDLAKLPSLNSQLPPFISLLLSIFVSLIRDSNSNDSLTENITSKLFSNVISTHIKLPLLKLIASIIQKKLYKTQNKNLDHEISYGFIFKNYLLSYFISVVSQNSCNVGIDKILAFQKALMGQSYMIYIPIYLYFAYGGGLFTIQSGKFKEQLLKMITGLGKILSTEQTIVTRNLQAIKVQKDRNAILSQSLNIACISKNRSYLQEVATKITSKIFRGKDYISKQDFIQSISQLETSEINIMSFYFILLRTQFQIVEKQDFVAHLQQKQKSQKPSFYSMQMQKILKKCPYNGDDKCDCKKCQCVRRNRESAKLSQQKKRNAVEQLEPMKNRIDFLEHRNNQLQEENLVLKGLLNEIKKNPLFQSILRKTMEPISKILNE